MSDLDEDGCGFVGKLVFCRVWLFISRKKVDDLIIIKIDSGVMV